MPLTVLDLSSLPPPQVVEPLDFETIKASMIADLKARAAATGVPFTALLESDPAIKLIEACAYRELILRGRINDAAKANLLAFAGGTDLDHLAGFYGVSRLGGESDAAMRLRLQQRIQGWSTAGGVAHYRYWALSASAMVKDAAVSSPIAGQVRIAVLSTEGDGTPDEALLNAVRAMVGRDDVRVLTDAVEVVAASILPVEVAARIWLYPDTPDDVFAAVVGAFPAAVDAARGLGWDMTLSWIVSRLHVGGVHKVELDAPTATVTAGPDQCVALGGFVATMEGRIR
ncbi:MAG: baseplate J/gp47 family protein [Alphaproteobacteria bacterium]|nr:baseplate J/gp47 family protein [Alphaproteobacteria bacterium]